MLVLRSLGADPATERRVCRAFCWDKTWKSRLTMLKRNEDACLRHRYVSLTVVVDFLILDEVVILTLPSVLTLLCPPIKTNCFQSFQLVP